MYWNEIAISVKVTSKLIYDEMRIGRSNISYETRHLLLTSEIMVTP